MDVSGMKPVTRSPASQEALAWLLMAAGGVLLAVFVGKKIDELLQGPRKLAQDAMQPVTDWITGGGVEGHWPDWIAHEYVELLEENKRAYEAGEKTREKFKADGARIYEYARQDYIQHQQEE